MTTQICRRKAGVHERRVDDQVFLADPDTDGLFHLNPIGSAVWQLLEEPACMSDVTDLMAQAFPDVPSEQIAADINTLWDGLAGSGLIEPV